MTWAVPTWWSFVLLALAAYRTWRLFAVDMIFDRWRKPVMRRVPEKLHDGFECPFCFGFWVTFVWWLCWQVWPHGTLVIAALFALSGAVGVFAVRGDPD